MVPGRGGAHVEALQVSPLAASGTTVGALLFGAVWWQQGAVAAQSAAPAHPAHAPHWSYEGAEDPAHWAALSPHSPRAGRPPAIARRHRDHRGHVAQGAAGFAAARLDPADVRTVPVDIVNNGHTIQVDTVGSGVLVIGQDRYVLQQFHFHTPSEHTVDGRSYPLEAHFVHKTANGKLAVVGLLFEEGAENPALTPYWSRLPKSAGPPVDLGRGGVDVLNVLPARHDVYRYAGR